MGFLNQVTLGESRPPKILLYGIGGIGKSTFGANMPQPVFIRAEDGLVGNHFAKTARLPLINNYNELELQLEELACGQHDFRTVVLDSTTGVEKYIYEQVATSSGKDDISDIGYGAGYQKAVGYWKKVLELLDACNRRGMAVLVVGHSSVSKFTPPDQDAYDRYVPELKEDQWKKIYNWSDHCLFVNYKTIVKEADGKSRAVTGERERVMFTQTEATHVAKNRIGMPPQVPFSWEVVAEYLRKEKEGTPDGQ